MFKSLKLALLLTVTCGLLTANAAVPHLLNYQGRLTDSSGTPLNGTYAITFRIYDAEAAGNLLWQGTYSNVSIAKGIFNILLGDVNDAGYNFTNLAFDKPYWLEIKVGNEVMTPRQKITSSGYAIRAEKAEKADSLTMTAQKGDVLYFNGTAWTNLGAGTAGQVLQTQGTSGNPQWINQPSLGSWTAINFNQVYQAVTDGFVMVYLNYPSCGNACNVNFYTDASNPPATLRTSAAVDGCEFGNGHQQGLSCPVKKGDYYKLASSESGGGTKAAYFIPLR